MKKPKVGFIVYGVHKDGLKDPMGTPLIDGALMNSAKKTENGAATNQTSLRMKINEINARITT